ncbi:GTP-binding protein [Candidatus Micrarchaeota archaeon]|nr:GTP-binding protein [Candidatus Micrarchaeota archaeon]
MDEYLSFVMVGHIDHGKSTLIGRLLYDTNSLPEGKTEEIKKTCEMLGKKFEFAYVMDHLDEEREKGITIETSQIFFKNGNKNYVIIDAPGHKEFIKNMLTGASQADAAVIIVDADEGVMEQTTRHAYLVNMLGIKQIIVVLNKMDKIDYSQEKFENLKNNLHELLLKFQIKPTYVIPISAIEGENIIKKSKKMDWYSGLSVIEALDTFKKMVEIEKMPLRMPIQDVYDIGEKIYVGKIESGTIKKGMEVVILPSEETAKIKSLELYGSDIIEANVGRSIGITFTEDVNIKRGAVICEQNGKPEVSNRITANIFWMGEKPLDKEERIIYKSTTQEINGTVEKIKNKINSSSLEVLEEESKKLEGLEAAEIIIKLEKPAVFDDFNHIPPTGRFVIIKDGIVQGGGIITSRGEAA